MSVLSRRHGSNSKGRLGEVFPEDVSVILIKLHFAWANEEGAWGGRPKPTSVGGVSQWGRAGDDVQSDIIARNSLVMNEELQRTTTSRAFLMCLVLGRVIMIVDNEQRVQGSS